MQYMQYQQLSADTEKIFILVSVQMNNSRSQLVTTKQILCLCLIFQLIISWFPHASMFPLGKILKCTPAKLLFNNVCNIRKEFWKKSDSHVLHSSFVIKCHKNNRENKGHKDECILVPFCSRILIQDTVKDNRRNQPAPQLDCPQYHHHENCYNLHHGNSLKYIGELYLRIIIVKFSVGIFCGRAFWCSSRAK